MSHEQGALGLSGELSKDSPACFGVLRRALGDAGTAAMAGVFRRLHDEGRLVEEPVQREAGVSYNPRPARVCQLLAIDGSERDPEVLAASMEAACPPLQERDSQPLAASARASLETARWPADEPTQAILLALLLDDVRHLHMTTLSEAERLAFAERAAHLAAQPCPRRLEPLRAKLLTSIERFLRSREP